MKNLKNLLAAYALAVSLPASHGQERLSRFGGLSPDDPALNNPARVFTDEDLADPPPGEIRKRYLHDVAEVRASLLANLAAAPAGPEGQQSPWMAKFQALITGMDQVSASRLQRDVMNLIPKMKEIFEGSDTAGYSHLFSLQAAVIRSLDVCVVHAIAEHVADQGANVAPADLADFVTVFSTDEFMHEGIWVDEIMPIDAAGVMILNPAAVVSQLKTLPWEQVDIFLGLAPANAFNDYETAGGGLPVLRTKYAANKVAILAKWQELQTWVAQKKAANP